MKLLTRRWMKRTIAIVVASTFILVGIVLMMEWLGVVDPFLDERHTPYGALLIAIGTTIAGIFILVRFNVEPDHSDDENAGIRVNILCLIGACLALFCMLELGWASGGYSMSFPNRLVGLQVDWVIYPPIEYFATGEVYSWFFVIGAVLAFFSPLAGYLQLFGVTLFAFRLHDYLNGPAGSGSLSLSGYAIAIVATSIIIVSLAFPYGVGYKGKPVDMLARLLTISSPALSEKITRWRRHEIHDLFSTDSHP